ncbi:unnamed protein product [Linum trigynum]|uniref:Protein FAR1-RELATED SEQUENCE n=1 Tax=Linum trigynum TaxID=586398 RepID=A0AAV2FN54_9ROSI
MDYLRGEWLPCRERWANCYTNRIFHIGNTSTNRVESMHSSLKKWLATSTHKIDTLFLRFHTSVNGRVIELRKDLEDSLFKVFALAYGPPYVNLNTTVSLWEVELLMEERERKIVQGCGCRIHETHGLPCKCKMDELSVAGVELHHHHLHPFWSSLVYESPPDLA